MCNFIVLELESLTFSGQNYEFKINSHKLSTVF